MSNRRLRVGRSRRLLLWLLPLLSLALAILACSGITIGGGVGRGRYASPPPVTHLPAAQLRMEIQIGGQYDSAPNVQVAVRIFEATSPKEVSLADKAALTCNGSDIKPDYQRSKQLSCPRQPPGGAYRIVYTDEHGVATTIVVPVPSGSFAILSPRDGATVHIPAEGGLAVHFTLPIPPPNSRITQLEGLASCHAAAGATCGSFADVFTMSATPTPFGWIPTATVFENYGPPTPTPSSSKPTATVFENRGPPTPTPPPGSTPTVPVYDGTVTLTGGVGDVVLNGSFTEFQPGPGNITLSIVEQVAPDPGAFAAASATMAGNAIANITWVR